ncbi:Gfo/Idh/MocA family protein [Paenibacillus sp. HJGM_3]|uniref:Gfo/Idh/MocA family protein n=1 Tax=Paenibacillus sp. HJGM_3 TaxID=3379816 RepID=UPI00386ADEFC
MSYRFGIYGCQHGHILSFIDQMLALGGTCSGIYEPDSPGLAQQISDRHGIPLVDNPDVFIEDRVSIIGSSAINNRKIDVVEWCERHGKHVMLDKPVVTNRKQLERLEAVFDRGTIQVGVLLTERFRRSIFTLKQSIDAGQLGRIVSITMRKPHRLSPASRHAWHFSKEENGGLLIDLFIHDFDLLRFLTGQEITAIQSQMAKHIAPEHPTFFDTASAQVMMSDGTLAQLYADWHTPDPSWTWGDCRLFITGTEGCAELRLSGDPAVEVGELYFQITRDKPFAKAELLPDPDTNLTQDFIRRIEGRTSIITHRDIVETIRATVLADESALVFDIFKR